MGYWIFWAAIVSKALACSYSEAAVTSISPEDYAFVGRALKVLGPFATESDPRFGGPAETYGLAVEVSNPIIPTVRKGEVREVYTLGPCGHVASRNLLEPLVGRKIRVMAFANKRLGVLATGGLLPMEVDEPPLKLNEHFDYSAPKSAQESGARRFHYRIDLLRLKNSPSDRVKILVIERLLKDSLYNSELASKGQLKAFLAENLSAKDEIGRLLTTTLRAAITEQVAAVHESRSDGAGLTYCFKIESLQKLIRNSPDAAGVLRDIFRNEQRQVFRRLTAEAILKVSGSPLEEFKKIEIESGVLASITWPAEGRLLMNVSDFWRHRLEQDSPARNEFLNGFGKEYLEREEIHPDLDNVSISVTREMQETGIAQLIKKEASWAVAALLLHEEPALQDTAKDALKAWRDTGPIRVLERLESEAEVGNSKDRREVGELRRRLAELRGK